VVRRDASALADEFRHFGTKGPFAMAHKESAWWITPFAKG
jgi:hypothetical protein